MYKLLENDKHYLNLLKAQILTEFIDWNKIPTTIYQLGRSQVWYLNIKAKKLMKPKILKPTLYLIIEDSNALKTTGGKSTGRVRHLYDPSEMVGRKVVDKGDLTMNSHGLRRFIELKNFKGFKTIKSGSVYHLDWGRRLRNAKDFIVVIQGSSPVMIRRIK